MDNMTSNDIFESLKSIITIENEKKISKALIIFMTDNENKIIYINNKINGYNSLPEKDKPIVSKYFLADLMFQFGIVIADEENKHYMTDHLIDLKTTLCSISQTDMNAIIDCIISKLDAFAYGSKSIFKLYNIDGTKLMDAFLILLKGYNSKGYIDKEDILFANSLYSLKWHFKMVEMDDITIEV